MYRKYVLPWVIELAMRNKEATQLRAKWIPRACGNVLEIGIGSGLNLPFYREEVRRVHGVDPSAELQRMARKRAGDARVPVEFALQPADEPLPFPEENFDTVVVTWTLCSIPDAAKALNGMKKALKRGGHLIFVEHGQAPEEGVRKWQDRLTPLWKRIGGGCHLNRKVDEIIESAGFEIIELKTGYLPGPRPMTYIYQGLARRV